LEKWSRHTKITEFPALVLGYGPLASPLRNPLFFHGWSVIFVGGLGDLTDLAFLHYFLDIYSHAWPKVTLS